MMAVIVLGFSHASFAIRSSSSLKHLVATKMHTRERDVGWNSNLYHPSVPTTYDNPPLMSSSTTAFAIASQSLKSNYPYEHYCYEYYYGLAARFGHGHRPIVRSNGECDGTTEIDCLNWPRGSHQNHNNDGNVACDEEIGDLDLSLRL